MFFPRHPPSPLPPEQANNAGVQWKKKLTTIVPQSWRVHLVPYLDPSHCNVMLDQLLLLFLLKKEERRERSKLICIYGIYRYIYIYIYNIYIYITFTEIRNEWTIRRTSQHTLSENTPPFGFAYYPWVPVQIRDYGELKWCTARCILTKIKRMFPDASYWPVWRSRPASVCWVSRRTTERTYYHWNYEDDADSWSCDDEFLFVWIMSCFMNATKWWCLIYIHIYPVYIYTDI